MAFNLPAMRSLLNSHSTVASFSGHRMSMGVRLHGILSLNCIYVCIPCLYFTADGLSVDWVSGKLYWTDVTLQHIEVYDTTTENRRVVIRTGNTTKPRAIVVDPATQ